MPLSALTVVLKQSVDLAQLASNVQRLVRYGILYSVSYTSTLIYLLFLSTFGLKCMLTLSVTGPITGNYVSLFRRPRCYLAQRIAPVSRG